MWFIHIDENGLLLLRDLALSLLSAVVAIVVASCNMT
jgi:hypothetical protein